MIKWFENLSEGWQIAIFSTVGIPILIGLCKRFLGKKDDATQKTTIKKCEININTKNDEKNLRDWYNSKGNQYNNCTFIFEKAMTQEEIKEILAKDRDQESEND